MSGSVFVDTNILIYAHDRDAGVKHDIAASLIEKLWEAGNGVLSTQVMQEFYVNVTRKIAAPLTPGQARSIIGNYAAWRCELNDPEIIMLASEIEERNRLSFWDALNENDISQSDIRKRW